MNIEEFLLIETFLKTIQAPDSIELKEKQRLIRDQFIVFCENQKLLFSVKNYKRYRSAVRSFFGFDLIQDPPKAPMKHKDSHSQMSLFD